MAERVSQIEVVEALAAAYASHKKKHNGVSDPYCDKCNDFVTSLTAESWKLHLDTMSAQPFEILPQATSQELP